MISIEVASEQMELFRHMHGAPPLDSDSGARHAEVITKFFAAAATDVAHSDRMVNYILVHCSFFPKALDIETAANATRVKPEPEPFDTTLHPITKEELESPEFKKAAAILGCRSEDLFGPAGSAPDPLRGVGQGIKALRSAVKSEPTKPAQQVVSVEQSDEYREWMRQAEQVSK